MAHTTQWLGTRHSPAPSSTGVDDAGAVAGGGRGPTASVARLARLVRQAVTTLDLDLSGAVVLTEAATGAYVVTPVLAALAGATTVHALTRSTRFGTVDQVEAETLALAEALGVADRIQVGTGEQRRALFAAADVVTNSGHLRPIDAGDVAVMRDTAVVPLMFEAWEAQAGRIDLDLEALRARGVAVAGTNECHPDIDVFGHLGLMAVTQLADAGVSAYRGRVALICDNPFRESLTRGLIGAGAKVRIGSTLAEVIAAWDLDDTPDALVVALTPTGSPVLSIDDVRTLVAAWPAVVVTQFWGDLDRPTLRQAGVEHHPISDPGPGHMGVLPSRLGPAPIVSLQAGGLKVAQVLRIPPHLRTPHDLEYLDEL